MPLRLHCDRSPWRERGMSRCSAGESKGVDEGGGTRTAKGEARGIRLGGGD